MYLLFALMHLLFAPMHLLFAPMYLLPTPTFISFLSLACHHVATYSFHVFTPFMCFLLSCVSPTLPFTCLVFITRILSFQLVYESLLSTKMHLAYLYIHVHIRVTRPIRWNKIVADLYSPCHCLIYFRIFISGHLSYRAGKVWYSLVVFTCSCSALHARAVFTYSCDVCMFICSLIFLSIAFLVYFEFA